MRRDIRRDAPGTPKSVTLARSAGKCQFCWHQGVPLPWLELFEHLTSIRRTAAAARPIPGSWRWRQAERPGFRALIAGSVQGALMMPFTDAKIGAVQGSASGGTEPCPLCRGMSIWESPSSGVREARMSRTFILLGIILAAAGLLWPWTGGLGWDVCRAISRRAPEFLNFRSPAGS